MATMTVQTMEMVPTIPVASTHNDSYLKVLPRGGLETERLNRQHQFFPKNLGYLIHPSILPLISKPNPRIADIGCGTGVYLFDLAKHLPATATLHGFDISDAQFPIDSERKAPNVDFSTANAKLGFPEEHLGKYDMVHLRLLSPAMTSDADWASVARNAMSLLRPGGALQWCEESSNDKLVVYTQPPSQTLNSFQLSPDTQLLHGHFDLSQMIHRVWNIISGHYASLSLSNPFSYFNTVDLASILEDIGARHVRYETAEFTQLPEMRTPWTINMIECMRGVILAMMAENPMVEAELGAEEDVEMLFADMVERAREGRIYLRSDIHVHVAFKERVEGEAQLERRLFRARL